MNAGVPGTGLVTLFYVFWSLAMPVIELGRRLSGRASARGWRFVTRHLAMAACLAGFSAGTSILLVKLAVPSSPLGAQAGPWWALPPLLLLAMAVLAGRLAAGTRPARRRGRWLAAWVGLEVVTAEMLGCLLLVRALGINPLSCAGALVSLGALALAAVPVEAARPDRRGRRLGTMAAVANGLLAAAVCVLVLLGGLGGGLGTGFGRLLPERAAAATTGSCAVPLQCGGADLMPRPGAVATMTAAADRP